MPIPPRSSPPVLPVFHVLLMSPQIKVAWPDTRPVVALVENIKLIWNVSNVDSPRGAVGIVGGAVDAEPAIPKGVSEGRPLPASSRDINLLPESKQRWLEHQNPFPSDPFLREMMNVRMNMTTHITRISMLAPVAPVEQLAIRRVPWCGHDNPVRFRGA